MRGSNPADTAVKTQEQHVNADCEQCREWEICPFHPKAEPPGLNEGISDLRFTPGVSKYAQFNCCGETYSVTVWDDDWARSVAKCVAKKLGAAVQEDGSILLPGRVNEVEIKGTLKV
jgi:hypothetical protein